MNEVFAKTRELGEALLRSDEFKAVKDAENKAMSDPEAAQIVGRFIELRSDMEKAMSEGEKDWVKIGNLSSEIDTCREKMNGIEVLNDLDSAREAFSELINQINSVLRFIVTGDMTPGEGACSGSCATCSGCSSKVN
ncbi:MAG: YlbF family regulator [Clostridia bacterium]|nr:YlbF family regulator [Clostridia bacterium]